MKYFLFLFTAILFSCTGQKDKITFQIKGWGNDTVYVEYYSFSELYGADTLYAKQGKFSYTAPTDKMTQLRFYRTGDLYPRKGMGYLPSAKQISILARPEDRLKVRGNMKPDAIVYKVTGTPLMEDMSRVRSKTLHFEIQIDSCEFGLIAAKERRVPVEEEEVFFTCRRELNYEIREIEREFVRTYPENEMSAFFILSQPIDSFPVYYALLPQTLKEGDAKHLLDKKLLSYEKYQIYLENQKKKFIGNTAPDFTLTDIDNRLFTLSSFDPKGKYIVLDFWGSWCGPCIMGIPEMKRYYDKYSTKLEIIGIACNDKEENWRNAVLENTLPWVQLLNNDSSKEYNVGLRYAISGYPTKIILSPEKNIVSIFKGESKEFYRELDELLK